MTNETGIKKRISRCNEEKIFTVTLENECDKETRQISFVMKR